MRAFSTIRSKIIKVQFLPYSCKRTFLTPGVAHGGYVGQNEGLHVFHFGILGLVCTAAIHGVHC